jgi:transcriptional regulator with XRE-family HTH domain
LRELRQASGLSVRELARRIDQQPTNGSYWERTGQTPRSDVLLPMAAALGVSVEQLLGANSTRRRQGSAVKGRLQQVFAAASQLPRRQQDKIAEFVEAFVAQHREKNAV